MNVSKFATTLVGAALGLLVVTPVLAQNSSPTKGLSAVQMRVISDSEMAAALQSEIYSLDLRAEARLSAGDAEGARELESQAKVLADARESMKLNPSHFAQAKSGGNQGDTKSGTLCASGATGLEYFIQGQLIEYSPPPYGGWYSYMGLGASGTFNSPAPSWNVLAYAASSVDEVIAQSDTYTTSGTGLSFSIPFQSLDVFEGFSAQFADSITSECRMMSYARINAFGGQCGFVTQSVNVHLEYTFVC